MLNTSAEIHAVSNVNRKNRIKPEKIQCCGWGIDKRQSTVNIPV